MNLLSPSELNFTTIPLSVSLAETEYLK